MRKELIQAFGIIAVLFIIFIAYVATQTALINDVNRATIIGGVLSMFGGIVGALGAYFIARLQMTKQLDLQYKKERQKMILEININKHQEVIAFINDIKKQFNKYEDEYTNYNFHIRDKINSQDETGIDRMSLIESLNIEKYFKCRDLFNEIIENYNLIFTFKVFFKDDFIRQLEGFNEGLYKFKFDVNNYMLFNYMNREYSRTELQSERVEKEEKIYLKLVAIESDLNIQLGYIETELYNLLQFNKQENE